MQSFRPLLGFIMSALLLVGCGSAFRVFQNKTRTTGVPFFVKTAVCEHSTVYVFPFYVLTYQTLSGGKVQTSETVTISAAAYDNANKVKEFLEILRKTDQFGRSDFDSANTAWNAIKQDPNIRIEPHTIVGKPDSIVGLHRVANTGTAKVLVDYDTPYTLNARIPLAGSVNATYKLNADGTLSEGSAQVVDKTFETILSFFSETLKTASKGKGFIEGVSDLQATVEKRALKITYSEIRKFNKGCEVKGHVNPNIDGSFVVEEIGPKDNSQKDDAKAKGREMTVTGKITLPEE